ncbi:MAG: CDP-glycerol glycerophosphotransferase family protein [Methanobacteriaceae archaeon]|nr:CDP-glycerol glycerophosphotransferase family protein [Methanobacteriaceae archaeon]MDZ4170560.1 CDP-glycerol glycerophosphotransferase family protein [Methanobacteriaceae archaeon]
MYDYCVLNRPMFFFMHVLEEYRDELRGFYSDVLEEIPRKTEELINDISLI